MQMPTKLHITSPDPLAPTDVITHVDRLAARFFLGLGLLSLYVYVYVYVHVCAYVYVYE